MAICLCFFNLCICSIQNVYKIKTLKIPILPNYIHALPTLAFLVLYICSLSFQKNKQKTKKTKKIPKNKYTTTVHTHHHQMPFQYFVYQLVIQVAIQHHHQLQQLFQVQLLQQMHYQYH